MRPTNSLWVEKYRPQSFDEIMDQPSSVALLKSFLEHKRMPHIILTGPPGTGKTSAAQILVRSMFPKEILQDRVLELNASEERGIRTVRGKIKRFVSSSIPTIVGVPPLSIVILDEADALTLDSQFALRRVMEDNCKNSRFILICNYINRIISPILSRCSVIKFNALRRESVKEIIDRVCVKEGIKKKKTLNHLDELVEKDARFAINILQKSVTGAGIIQTVPIQWDKVVSLQGVKLLESIEDLLLDGYDADFLVESFVEWVSTNHETIDPDFFRVAMTVCCHTANHGTPEIQLTSLVCSFHSSQIQEGGRT